MDPIVIASPHNMITGLDIEGVIQDRLNVIQGHLNIIQDHLNIIQDHLNIIQDHLNVARHPQHAIPPPPPGITVNPPQGIWSPRPAGITQRRNPWSGSGIGSRCCLDGICVIRKTGRHLSGPQSPLMTILAFARKRRRHRKNKRKNIHAHPHRGESGKRQGALG